LRKVVEELEDDDVQPLSPDYPGLNGLAAMLVQDKFLAHRDKEVRLHAVLACVEIFTVVSETDRNLVMLCKKTSPIHYCSIKIFLLHE
jgi:cupin superfamily acireductone dioxygenase involved in methionine salvage